MKFFNKSFLLLVLLSVSLVFAPIVVRAEDAADESDEDAVVNEEATGNEEAAASVEAEGEEEAVVDSLASPFVRTNVLFIKPESTDLPAGRLARLLVSFQNNGSAAFLVEGIEGSLRFPQDFSYHIQNFTAFEFNKVVESERESTFEYMFTPSETFSQRQFGLIVNLRYRDLEGKQFLNTVFNETISIVDFEEGFDGETFFLYVFLAAIVVLLAVAAQHFLSKKSKIGRVFASSSHKASNGHHANSNSNDVDFGWIPKEHLQQNKSPRTSPRQRNGKNGNAVSATGNSSNDEQ